MKQRKNGTGKQKGSSIFGELVYLLVKIIFIVISFLLLFTFVFGIFRMDNINMLPAIKASDLVLFYRLDSSYHSGDVVVLNRNKEQEVLRIVAVPGDQVDITNEGLEVNGHPQYGLEKSYVWEETKQFRNGVTLPITLEKNEFFVMGDNRMYSEDSRIYGPVRKDDIQGKLITIIRRRNF